MLIRQIKQMKWSLAARKLKHIGSGSYVASGFAIHGAENISIGKWFRAGRNLKLQTWTSYRGEVLEFQTNLTIGNKVSFMDNVQISCMKSVSIGDGTLLGDNVFISDNSHGNPRSKEELKVPPIERKLFSKGPISIGENVWIGRNVCIIGNVSIGSGAVIGANSVVTHDIPSYCVAAGVPARVLSKKGCAYDKVSY